eukprot:TRINITY_DN2453_c0_g1_i2.p2 TRINITY_DN2453_c0_g1~~TRINITY_DN2453_c0_g1_i2.p2  ORF type:complete len:133 (+),score=15.98 TRINITY_DN2453_c0_g1_i2:287-685(+)
MKQETSSVRYTRERAHQAGPKTAPSTPLHPPHPHHDTATRVYSKPPASSRTKTVPDTDIPSGPASSGTDDTGDMGGMGGMAASGGSGGSGSTAMAHPDPRGGARRRGGRGGRAGRGDGATVTTWPNGDDQGD